MDSNLIGAPLSRFDGLQKVTGSARYAAEHAIPGLAYSVAVQSSIVRGAIQQISTATALACPGVLDVLTFENAPRLGFLESNSQNRPGQTYLVLQDNAVLYQGQYIAVVTAETLEQARYASSLLETTFLEKPCVTELREASDRVFKPKRITVIDAPVVDSCRGEPGAAFLASPVQLDLNFNRTSIP